MNVEKESISKQYNIFDLSHFMGDMSYVGLANAIIFIFAVFQAFFAPKILSVEEYGYWRLFTLYITFSGLLHFGFIDGFYLYWAGKRNDEIKLDIHNSFITLLLVLSATTVLLLLIIYALPVRHKDIFLLMLFYAFIFNVNFFFQNILQAVKKFKIVSRYLTLVPIAFNGSVLILYLVKLINYYNMIICLCFANFVVLAGYVLMFRDQIFAFSKNTKIDLNILKKHMQVGWPLLMGNFLVLFIFNADMIFISTYYDVRSFAYYSFAIACLNVAGIFIRTIATVFFPHLAGTSARTKVGIFKFSMVIIITTWVVILGLYSGIEILIRNFLSKYLSSLPYLKVLLLSIVFYTSIQVLHNNYYQLHFEQKRYFIVSALIMLITIISYYLIVRMHQSIMVIAGMKVGLLLIWTVVNELTLRKHIVQTNIVLFRKISVIIVIIALFLVSFMFDNLIIRIVGFYLSSMIILWLVYKKDYRGLIGHRIRVNE